LVRACVYREDSVLCETCVKLPSEVDVEVSNVLAQDVGEGQIADTSGDAIGDDRE